MTAFKDRPADEKSNVTGYVHDSFVAAFKRMQSRMQDDAGDHINVDAGTVVEALIFAVKDRGITLDLDALRQSGPNSNQDRSSDSPGGGDGPPPDEVDGGDDSLGSGVEDPPDGPEDPAEGDEGDGEGSDSVLSREWF